MFYETRGKQVVYTMGADMETHPILRVLSELTVEMMSIPETSFATFPKPMVTRRYEILRKHCFDEKVPEVSDSQSEIAKLKDGSSVSIIDVENAATSTNAATVTLSVQGMTCTGCEKTLQKALASIPSVSDIKTNLLLAQAEFSLEESASYHIDNIAQVIEAKTGFFCKKIDQEGEELELTLPHRITKLSGNLPKGVLDLHYNGQYVRVSYDPRIIGARTVCAHHFFQSAHLSPPSPPPVVAAGRAQFRKELYMTILSAILTIPVLILAYAKLPKHDILYGAISLFLATMVQGVVAREFYVRAFRTLIFSRMAEMDMLVVLSSTTAYIYSVIAYGFLAAGDRLPTGQFFETSTLLVTLIMVGRTIATFSRQSAVESISIESLQVQTATVVDDTGKEETIDARLLQYGDTFKVLPDIAIVTDGIIIEGKTEVDESMVTGEAILITKQPGDSIIAGSLNHSGTILVKLTRLPSENTIKTISAMVDEAKSSKAKVQEIADQVAGYFTYGILAITILVFLIWVAVGKAVRHQSTSTACINAMTFAISTLIVSCPCAIGLAVPMVVLIAGGVGARQGLIFKTGESLEIARKVTHIVFDKTGTLTEGNLSVVEEEYFDAPETVLPLILAITANSNHPVSRGIHSHLKSKTESIKPAPHITITSIPGSGLEAKWQSHTLRAGNAEWLSLTTHSAVTNLLSLNLTTLCITLDNKPIAIFGLRDTLRPSSLPLITALKRRGIGISLVSGDNASSVFALATQLRIEKENVRAGYHPAQKAEYVKSLLEAGGKGMRKRKRRETVMGKRGGWLGYGSELESKLITASMSYVDSVIKGKGKLSRKQNSA
ncbi:hypothetical protein EG329_005207 [Mollisiaceae sp. DMI_Dod_QoI]|nr:hypothetical protein EG329_005207 [Helotiales sp. DMI_Dod_QoI]